MSSLDALRNVAIGAGIGVATVASLPIFGPIGAVTATGTLVGSFLGGGCALWDFFSD